MGLVKNSSQAIAPGYPQDTGRVKHVQGNTQKPKKVALLGDSTLDNGYWVDKNKPYSQKTHTVTHQTAVALSHGSESYDIGNFAVDGATTDDLMEPCSLAKVLPIDEDHKGEEVHQLNAVAAWQPDVAVLSVGGNNYREALANTLLREMNTTELLLRITPEKAKLSISQSFEEVKKKILEDYKKIIDELIQNNPQLSRIVLLSQYYPSITKLTPYFIYTGFSHLARAEGKGRDPFTMVEETMNDLYRDILTYAASKEKEIVFVDVTSSLNPLGGNHTMQIEPNEQGSVVMGQLIAGAVNYTFPQHQAEERQTSIVKLSLDTKEQQIRSQILTQEDIHKFSVKKISQFISESRYNHLRLLFSPSSSLMTRFESTFHAMSGNQFDDEFSGLPALGLIDVTLVPILASSLWRVALNEEVHTSLRVMAGTVAAPILLAKMIVSLAVTLALSLPLLGLHAAMSLCSKSDTPPNPAENPLSH